MASGRKRSTLNDSEKFMRTCDVCGSTFQYGRHLYAGRWLTLYQLLGCDDCLRGNHDGWGPVDEPKILEHLRQKGLPVPARNEKGWLPID